MGLKENLDKLFESPQPNGWEPGPIQYLYDDEVLFIPNTEDLSQQKCTGCREKQRRAKEVPSERTRSFFSGWLRYFFPWRWQHVHHRIADDFCECSLPHPKVFVLHQRGQQLQEIYSKQVPPNTILIAVNPSDYPGCNCFEARPVSLARLKQESQHA